MKELIKYKNIIKFRDHYLLDLEPEELIHHIKSMVFNLNECSVHGEYFINLTSLEEELLLLKKESLDKKLLEDLFGYYFGTEEEWRKFLDDLTQLIHQYNEKYRSIVRNDHIKV